jgi:hypothetical protein
MSVHARFGSLVAASGCQSRNQELIDARSSPSVPALQRRAGALPLEAGIALAIGLLQCWLIFHHSPWRDEEQALLIAQQHLGALFNQLHYEGHPALYYLMLKVATLAAPGVWALKLTAAACSLATLGLIWWRSPFGLPGKAALSLNYLVFFEYGVVARSYGLGALLFFAFVALRRARGIGPWVLLAMLANVSVHTAILAAVCALWLLKDDRWSWKGCAILGLGFVIAVVTLWPAPDAIRSVAATQYTPLLRAMGTLAKASTLLTWSDPLHPVAIWGAMTPTPVALVLGALFPLLGIRALSRNRDHQALFLLYFLALFAFGTVVYVAMLRHLGFAALFLVGLLWAQVEAGERLNAAAWTWMVLGTLGGVWFAVTALVVPFSGSAALSEWATQTGAADKPWATTWGPISVYYSGIAGRPIFNLEKGCWNTYLRWDQVSEKVVTNKDINTFAQATGGGYVLSPAPLRAAAGRQLEHSFDGPMLQEMLYVYRTWPVGPARAETLPTCP